MASRPLFLLLAAAAGAAQAQYKCIAANGGVTFQQQPCIGARSEERLVIVPNGHPPAASGAVGVPPAASGASRPEGSVDKRMLANYERQRQRDALVQALRAAQDEKARRAAQRDEAIAAARRQFGDDAANAPALRDAMAAVNSRYAALAGIDDVRIASAQDALDRWEKAQRPVVAASAPASATGLPSPLP